MPLDNKSDLHHFITSKKNDCLSLPFTIINQDTPIYQQWTVLSSFIQMISPISFSMMEGGHRMLAMIRFYTGKSFDAPCPHLINDEFAWPQELKDQISVDNVTQTRYMSHFVLPNADGNEDTVFDGNFSLQVREFSRYLMKAVRTRNEGTNFNLFADLLVEIGTIPFERSMTLNEGFQEWKGCYDHCKERFCLIRDKALEFLESDSFGKNLVDKLDKYELNHKTSAKNLEFDNLIEDLVST